MNQADIKRQQAEWLVHIAGLVGFLILGGALGDLGLAITLSAVYVYGMVWMLLGGNTAGAAGRLIRTRNMRNQYKNAARIRSVVIGIQLISGVLAGLLCVGAAILLPDRVFHLALSTLPILLMSPAVLFRCVSESLEGAFIGEGNGLPPIAASALRYLSLIVFGLAFVKLFGGYGEKVSALLGMEHYTAMYESVGVSAAVSVAELLVLVFLVFVYRSRMGGGRRREGGLQSVDDTGDICIQLFRDLGGRVLLGILIMLPLIMGLVLYRTRVQDEDVAASRYGIYGGKYLILCAVCFCALAGFLIPAYLKAASAARREEYRGGRAYFQSGFHMCMAGGLFFSVFLTVAATPLAGALEKGNAVMLAEMLQKGGFLVLFAILGYYATGFLIACGMRYQVLLCGMALDMVFILMVTMLLKRSAAEHIYALVSGGLLATAVYAVLVTILSLLMLRGAINWIPSILIPGAAACVSGLIVMLLEKLLTTLLGGAMSAVLCLVVMYAIYWGCLLALRNVSEQELRFVPLGGFLSRLGKTLHML